MKRNKTKKLRKKKGGAPPQINHLLTLEDNMDMFQLMIQYLTPEQFIQLYSTDRGIGVLIRNLQIYNPNFSITYNHALPLELDNWFAIHEIPLSEKGPDGSQRFYKNGRVHRDNDLPAEIITNEGRIWSQNGLIHRDVGPAIIYADRSQHWYQNGLKHRDDGPAEIDTDGKETWYQNGLKHRDDGPAEIDADGKETWYWNGRKKM